MCCNLIHALCTLPYHIYLIILKKKEKVWLQHSPKARFNSYAYLKRKKYANSWCDFLLHFTPACSRALFQQKKRKGRNWVSSPELVAVTLICCLTDSAHSPHVRGFYTLYQPLLPLMLPPLFWSHFICPNNLCCTVDLCNGLLCSAPTVFFLFRFLILASVYFSWDFRTYCAHWLWCTGSVQCLFSGFITRKINLFHFVWNV